MNLSQGVYVEAIVDRYAYTTTWVETRKSNMREYCANLNNQSGAIKRTAGTQWRVTRAEASSALELSLRNNQKALGGLIPYILSTINGIPVGNITIAIINRMHNATLIIFSYFSRCPSFSETYRLCSNKASIHVLSPTHVQLHHIVREFFRHISTYACIISLFFR